MSTSVVSRTRRRGAGVMVRVLLVMGVAALGFAVGGLLGIIVLGTLNASGASRNMYEAVYLFALPGAAVGALAGLGFMLWSERKARSGEFVVDRRS